jgi:hypothetical protein
MIVGAFALGAYIKPRSTGDIDFWINPTQENAKKAYQSIIEFGAPLQNLKTEDFEQKGTVFQIGLPPLRIDIITKISGVEFDEAWSDRAKHNIFGIEVSILSKHHLVQNKRAAGRPKDLLDVEELLKT